MPGPVGVYLCALMSHPSSRRTSIAPRHLTTALAGRIGDQNRPRAPGITVRVRSDGSLPLTAAVQNPHHAEYQGGPASESAVACTRHANCARCGYGCGCGCGCGCGTEVVGGRPLTTCPASVFAFRGVVRHRQYVCVCVCVCVYVRTSVCNVCMYARIHVPWWYVCVSVCFVMWWTTRLTRKVIFLLPVGECND